MRGFTMEMARTKKKQQQQPNEKRKNTGKQPAQQGTTRSQEEAEAVEEEESTSTEMTDGEVPMDASDVRMALDRLLHLNDAGVTSTSTTAAATAKTASSSSIAAGSATNSSTAAAAMDDETDSSSMSSHSSTLKGTTTSSGSGSNGSGGGRDDQNNRGKGGASKGGGGRLPHPHHHYPRPDRLNNANLPLGGQGPAPPSPRSTQAPLEGVSTEETLRKMSATNREMAMECQNRTITCRTPKDFFFHKVLGEGSFSTVYYAKEVDTGDEYAIKVSMKNEIRREGRVRYCLREKDIMAALTYAYGGHPFVIRLYCTFQDNDRLYFALAYAKHGELLDWLRRLGSFDEEATLFYASEILCALEFLHRCKVIHRDLKPENILVGADWHIMVSDFGTSKILADQTDGEADEPPPIEPLPPGEVPGQVPSVAVKPTKSRSSFVGTAHYISPEVLKSEDVGPECDYWALGAIIFQMISGQPPFRAVNEYKILKKILQLEYHFPEGFPEVARNLVSRLLVYKPAERLGSPKNGGIDSLKGHPFFKDVNWASMFTRKPPELKPYLPASCGEPAFYGDYRPTAGRAENIEPGLNEAALSRLMGLDSRGETTSGFGDFEFCSGGDALMNEVDGFFSSSPSSSSSSSFGSTPTSASSALAPHLKNAFPQMVNAEELERRHQCRLEHQRREHKYHRFVQENLILKHGLIDKKKGLFARRRMFLLTEGPHLFYVDPVNMHLKGEVPFSAQMRTEAKNFRTFFVHTPKRTYYLFDPERHAKDWCDAIDWTREKYFGQEMKTAKTEGGRPAEENANENLKEQQKRAKSPFRKQSTKDGGNGGGSGSRPGSGGKGGGGLIGGIGITIGTGRSKANKTAVKS